MTNKLRDRLAVPAGTIQNHPVGTQLLLKLSDILVIVLTLILLVVFDRGGLSWHKLAVFIERNFWLITTGGLVFLIAGDLVRLYRPWRWYSATTEMLCVTKAWAIAAVALLLVTFNESLGANSRSDTVFTWLLLTPVTLCVWRLFLRYLLTKMRGVGFNKRRVVVVGLGNQAVGLAREIEQRKEELGMRFLGFCNIDADDVAVPGEIDDLGVIGDSNQLLQLAAAHEVDVVYIALPAYREHDIRALIQRLADTVVSVHLLIPELFEPVLYSLTRRFGPYRTVSIYTTPFEIRINTHIKRLEDVLLSLPLLLIFAIPIALIALAIRATLGGPVIFKQQRYGLGGKSVEIWKFRTMTTLEETAKETQATRNDVRVTRLGAFLRRWSLDELPQLINVLQGQMSLIGPRPHPVSLNEAFRGQIKLYMLRHAIKPGITGWAQVNGWRGETETLEKMEKRVEHDLYYIRHWSVFLDIKILFMTMVKVITGKNAY